MKRILVIMAIALSIVLLTAPAAGARGRMQGNIASCRGGDCYGYQGGGCRGVDCAGVRNYSQAALETINGEVIEVYQATSRQGYKSGLHLLVKANEETIDVHLGPVSYIEGQNFNFEPGDILEIKGDRFTDSPMPTMTAVEVKKSDDTLILRDDDGFPMWRGSLRQQSKSKLIDSLQFKRVSQHQPIYIKEYAFCCVKFTPKKDEPNFI